METAEDLVDYALPLILIDQLAREIYEACLARDLVKAHEIALKLGAEARILQHTLTIMHDKEVNR